jgi:hypothetical protein
VSGADDEDFAAALALVDRVADAVHTWPVPLELQVEAARALERLGVPASVSLVPAPTVQEAFALDYATRTTRTTPPPWRPHE